VEEVKMRRKLTFAAVLTGSVVLMGCTHEGGPSGQAAIETSMPAGHAFHYVDEGDTAKLAFGEADSDNVGLMLQCAKGSRTIEVSDLVRSSPSGTLTLASGGQRSELKVEVMPGPAAAMAVGTAPVSAPALAGFRKSGQIEVSYAGHRYAMAARPQEKTSVERFFSACERAV